jgi:hypothetical protein
MKGRCILTFAILQQLFHITYLGMIWVIAGKRSIIVKVD